VLALFLRVWAPGPVTQTVDERLWMIRSYVFGSAVVHHHFAHASAWGAVPDVNKPTMPGVTTMWAGTIGRWMAGWGHSLGLNQNPLHPVPGSREVLRASRFVVALWCSVALVVFVWLAQRLVGRRAAWIAGVLLAVEPWFAGISDVLHTDAMVAMFGAVSIVALAVALRPAAASPGPDGEPPPGRWRRVRRPGLDVDVPAVILSAGFGGLALLTKLNAAALLGPALVIVVLADLWRRARSRSWTWGLLGRAAVVGLVWVALATIVFVALFPAMWVSPFSQISHMRAALDQLGGHHAQYYFGRTLEDPGPGFYAVALWYRLSPWLLVGSALALVALVVRPIGRAATSGRRFAWVPEIPLWTLLVIVPYLVIITTTPKKIDRYALPLIPFLALAVGTLVAAVVVLVERRVDRPSTRRWLAAAAIAVTAGLALGTASQAPYALSYVDPLAGGQRAAERDILLGWGEGTSALGHVIAVRERGRCDEVRIADSEQLYASLPCGHLVVPDGDTLHDVDYVVLHVSLLQRNYQPDLTAMVRQKGTLVARTRIDGVTYEELWHIPHPAG
jgi:4-amino-4-deoxy-L-arabinose transferase-like glycosyltransferase